MSSDAATSGCPRCGGGFHCGVNDAAPCACAGLTLDAALRASLRERFEGCLCVACLVELSTANEKPAESVDRPARGVNAERADQSFL